jgi:hypothetical protein
LAVSLEDTAIGADGTCARPSQGTLRLRMRPGQRRPRIQSAKPYPPESAAVARWSRRVLMS